VNYENNIFIYDYLKEGKADNYAINNCFISVQECECKAIFLIEKRGQ